MKRADWDRLAPEFESETCDITAEESADTVARFVALAGLPKRGAVLADLGCGVGTFIARFGDRFAHVHGVEFAPRIIARAKARCGGDVNWLTMSIPNAARRIADTAHLAVCMNVITQSSAASRARMWESLARATRRRGFALVVVPSMESERMVVAAGSEQRWRKGGLVERDGVWQKHYERSEIEDILASLGFTTKRIGRAHYPWSVEGLRETKARRDKHPWDWIVLARKR
jgi:SAM-dependent methyltransferase